MRTSTERIVTTHAGSLPRPMEVLESYAGDDRDGLDTLLHDCVRAVVTRQRDAGIDIVNDGEFGKPTDTTEDADHGHGVWALYMRERLSGLELVETEKPVQNSKDRIAFAGFYGGAGRRQPAEGGHAGTAGQRAPVLTCTGPIQYTGQELIGRDLRNLDAALGSVHPGDAFLAAVSPGSLVSLIPNLHYGDNDAYRVALAEALRHEYRAIADAGHVLQIDDPVLVASWDFWADDSVGAYRDVAARDVELLNHALEGIPREQIRYHLCWGSWQGPHRSDLPLVEIADLMLQVRAGAYVVEAANPRHEHEWKLWRELDLPADCLVIPGVVTHKTSVVEHPEVVADRILRYAGVVGRERVIAGTDCGMGGRISSDVAWAKLESLAAGARQASERLWPS
jgi:5-methyltetrahydropteroyltriglutamate--homocysteine methyltransferase